MATTRTTNSLSGTVPQLGDTANIETAFNAYHDSLANTSTGAAVLGRSNTFGGASGSNQIIKTANNGYLELSTVNASKSGLFVISTDSASNPIIFRPILAGTTQSSSDFYYSGTADRWVSEVQIYSNLVTRPGTSSQAPLTVTSGTNLTNIVAGTLEYDGNVFYATPKVNNTSYGRGLVTTPYVFIESANTTLTQSSALSTGSGGGTSTDSDTSIIFGSQYLAASSTYMIDSLIMVYHNLQTQGATGTITASATLGFTVPSSSTVSFDVIKTIDLATLTTSGTPSSEIYNSGTITIKSVSASDDTGYSIFRVRGVIRTSTTAGLFNPVINTAVVVSNDLAGVNSATAQCTLQANSYITVTPISGTVGDINIGGWS